MLVDSVGNQSRITVNLTILDFLPHLCDFSFTESYLFLESSQVTRGLSNDLLVLNVLSLELFLHRTVDVISLCGFLVSFGQLSIKILDFVRLRVFLSL